MSEHFPFSAAGAALLCGWTDDSYGLSRVSWVNAHDAADDTETFSATVGFADSRNVLRFNQSAAMDEQFAAAAAEAARACLDAHSVQLSDIDLVVAAPARPGYRAALSSRLGIPVDQITVADDKRMHTAALAAAFDGQVERLPAGTQLLFVVAGAGVTAGAALYRQPPRIGSEPGHR
jgi:3-oxoacyl-[acyl-carrier-protein] synthase-3